MATARFAWGIDIGNRALKAIKLVRGENGLVVDDFEIIEHETVLSSAGDNKDTLIQTALANFVQRHMTSGGSVAISVSGVSSFARFIKLPPVESKKIPEIVRFEAIQQIPFPLDDVEWSYQLFQTPDSPDVEVGIFAMRKELVNHQIKFFSDVGLDVAVVQMNPLAVYNAIQYDGRIKGTTMIIDLGAENTDLVIADGETIWLRSIPIGGNNFTDVLSKGFKLPFPKAEELKRNAATSKYARQIFQAMRPVFSDLVAEVQRSIGFYASVHRDSRIKKIIALGGAFRLPGLQKYLQQNLQIEVERLDRLAIGAPADGKLATTFNENLLSMISAYGLAVQAMGEGKIVSSLLPMHIRRAKLWRDKTKWFGLAAACFVLGTGVAMGTYYVQNMQFEANNQIRDTITTTLNRASDWDRQWKLDVEQAGAPDRKKIENVQSMEQGRLLWSNLLSDIYKALPAPQSAVADGLSKSDAASVKKIARTERTQVLIDRITSRYEPDLLAAVSGATGSPAGGGPGGPRSDPGVNSPVPVGSRGFVINIDVTTPHGNGFEYVTQSFAANLQAMTQAAMQKAGRDYYVARVAVESPRLVHENNERMQRLTQSNLAMNKLINPPTPAKQPGMPGGPGGPPYGPGGPPPYNNGFRPDLAPGQQFDPAAFQDRLTGEDMLNDWELTIEVDVALIDPAK